MASARTTSPGPLDVIVVAVADRAGADLARDLIGAGHRVAVAGPRITRLVDLVAGTSAPAMVVDLDDPTMVGDMFSRVGRRLGPVTLVADPVAPSRSARGVPTTSWPAAGSPPRRHETTSLPTPHPGNRVSSHSPGVLGT